MDKGCRICYIAHVRFQAPYPRGKGEVCKTFMHRFDSGRRLYLHTERSFPYGVMAGWRRYQNSARAVMPFS